MTFLKAASLTSACRRCGSVLALALLLACVCGRLNAQTDDERNYQIIYSGFGIYQHPEKVKMFGSEGAQNWVLKDLPKEGRIALPEPNQLPKTESERLAAATVMGKDLARQMKARAERAGYRFEIQTIQRSGFLAYVIQGFGVRRDLIRWQAMCVIAVQVARDLLAHDRPIRVNAVVGSNDAHTLTLVLLSLNAQPFDSILMVNGRAHMSDVMRMAEKYQTPTTLVTTNGDQWAWSDMIANGSGAKKALQASSYIRWIAVDTGNRWPGSSHVNIMTGKVKTVLKAVAIDADGRRELAKTPLAILQEAQRPIKRAEGFIRKTGGTDASKTVGVSLSGINTIKAGSFVNGWIVNGPNDGWYVLKRPGGDASRDVLVPPEDEDAETIARKAEERARKLGQRRGDLIVVAGDPRSARYQQVVNDLKAQGYNVEEFDVTGLDADDALTAVADEMENVGARVAAIVTAPDHASAESGRGGRRKKPKRGRRPSRPRRQLENLRIPPFHFNPPLPDYMPEPVSPVPSSPVNAVNNKTSVTPRDNVGGIDLSEMSLTYVSGNPAGSARGEFGELFRAPFLTASKPTPGVRDRANELRTAFRLGLALSPDRFWVNLNPREPDRITDPLLSRTDVGRVLLEADLQLKRDTSAITDPRRSDIGREYWRRLEEYSGETRAIQQRTRTWIIPGVIEVSATGENAALEYADLAVRSETQYLSARQSARISLSVSDRLFAELVLPQLEDRVNYAPEYAELRRIYRSLILARWYRDRYRGSDNPRAALIDTERVDGLESRSNWSPKDIWQRYLDSVRHGEYDFTERTEEVQGNMHRILISRYFSGGVDFTDLAVPTVNKIDASVERLALAVRKPEGAAHGDELWFSDVKPDLLGLSPDALQNSLDSRKPLSGYRAILSFFATVFAASLLLYHLRTRSRF